MKALAYCTGCFIFKITNLGLKIQEKKKKEGNKGNSSA